jgi:hypothetical protein
MSDQHSDTTLLESMLRMGEENEITIDPRACWAVVHR